MQQITKKFFFRLKKKLASLAIAHTGNTLFKKMKIRRNEIQKYYRKFLKTQTKTKSRTIELMHIE